MTHEPIEPPSPLRAPRPTRATRMEALAVLPVFYKLAGRRAVLAGGGEGAAWKAELLSAAGADVDVYAAEISGQMREVAEAPPAGGIRLVERDWQSDDLAGAAIAVGAITDAQEGLAFADAARAHGVPVNVIDRPELCQFQFGSIVNRSPLVVAISTDGSAPVFGQAIRSRIESWLPQGFKLWAQAAKSWRRQAGRLGATVAERRRFWELFTQTALNRAETPPTARDLEDLIAQAAREREGNPGGGFVSLVGAGPGDPELLTLRAVRALRSADVILYDDLVSDAVMEFARREARRILVGKTGYGPSCKQTQINALMVELAGQGNRVVRLKSGDPMIFGRAGEEVDVLRSAEVAFEVIPGISAVQAAAASLNVSLTHRDHAKRLQLVTGHSREGRLPDTLDWQALADQHATTAVYMAQRTLAELTQKLIASGMPPATPAVATFNLTRADARTITGTIATLPGLLQTDGIKGPCLVLIGEVFRAATTGQAPAMDLLVNPGGPGD